MKPNVIIDKDSIVAAESAEKLGISNLEYDFIPMTSCYVHLINSYPIEGRKFYVPKNPSIGDHGRSMVSQLKSSLVLLEEKGVEVVEYEV